MRSAEDSPAAPVVAVVDCGPDDRPRLERLEAAVPTRVCDGPAEGGALVERAAGCAVLATLYTYTPVTEAVLDGLPGLRLVITRTAGSSHIDLGAAQRRGIAVATVPEGPTQAVAEYTIAAAIALSRGLPAAVASTARGEWDFTGFRGHDLGGRTLGVVGLGHIGARVAQLGQAFGMRVVGWSRSEKGLDGVEQVPLPALLQRAHVVSVNVALAAETHRLLDAAALARMRPDAVLVNTSRGETIDLDALCDLLRAGRLGGAWLDVVEGEPGLPAERLEALAAVPNLFVTPHISWHTHETLDRQFDGMIDRILAFCAQDHRTEEPHHASP
ncbi:2-hydroxyacid dehydrogenase [Capillimicrobium parvum]|uniref:Formate dehydrogenase, mitochondrial n=1 Tax=Capillimicrobium parvum TaxID=2884022 RepID=A0A9E6XVV7_9ACTN|nr:2-hydroxyacid dehydrogenase [Capillimicrobium parvum]UGS34731.1 Formate dehydrogenase, mitochondrial [Capillimicrobium parvum]